VPSLGGGQRDVDVDDVRMGGRAERVNRARARFVREFEASLRDSRTAGQPTDPELLAHHLLAVLWESGRLLLVSPNDFTHDRLLCSLDALLTAMVAQQRKGSR
jgi:hypothetical protein